MNIKGYDIQKKLSQGKNFTIYLVSRVDDTAPFVLKVLERKTIRNPNVVNAIKHEYHLLKQIYSDYVIKSLDWLEGRDYVGISLEDIKGKPLKNYIKNKKIPVSQFIELAYKITTGLEAIHEQNIIHKDINPTNIVWNSQSGSLKIIDFNIASTFDIKVSHSGNPEKLQGTLPYISPEQTGRMNCRVDWRSDLYSLGVTFYEMLTGRLPFEHHDPMEIVYAHLARAPEPPHIVNQEVPPVLSKIVLKLLAKNPEERYQSAGGLIHDLEKAVKLHFRDFKLAERDFSGKLHIPEKLYGRQEQLKLLLDAYQRVSNGAKEMILVTGYSGTGKTALVNEIHKPITKDRGYFISGKFDQLQRTVPYFAFIQALTQFCQLLLAEGQDVLALWKERILHSVGTLGKILTDIIPQLESVIGKQPDIPEVGGEEAKKRFDYVFQRFLHAVSTEQHPLVFFIDDLQWVDPASLGLLQLLMEDRQNQYLLFIGAYRDNEVSSTHPLVMAIEGIQKQDFDIITIPVGNLSKENVREWLGDTLRIGSNTELKEAAALTDLIYQKTQGNAFFTIQFMENLYRKKLLIFDLKQSKWIYDIIEIKKQNISDNVVDLLVRKIQILPLEGQEVLKMAACIGNVFSLRTLSVISEKGKEELERTLEIALTEHLVYLLGDEEYKFEHDRIHQAAYSLISDEYKKPLHLKIGRLLLENVGTSLAEDDSHGPEQHLFDIVNHLNISIDLLETEQEKLELAKINLKAGRDARRSGAYKLGSEYLQKAMALLPIDCWQHHYELTLTIYNEALQAYYLCGNFKEMEDSIECVLTYSHEIAHKSVAYEYRIMGLIVQNQESLASDTLIKIFNDLGVEIPRSPGKTETESTLAETHNILRHKGVETIKDLPEMNSSQKRIATRLLYIGSGAFSFGAQELMPYVTSKIIGFILKCGLTEETPYILSLYGISRYFLGDISDAYQLGEVSMDLLNKKTTNESIKARSILIICAYLIANKQHYKETYKLLIDTYPCALNAGDFEFATYILINYIQLLSRTDIELSKWKEIVQGIKEKIIELKQSIMLGVLSIETAFNSNLLGENPNPVLLKTELDDILDDMDEGGATIFKCSINIKRVILAYFFEEYDNIKNYINTIKNNWKRVTTPLIYLRSDIYFYIPLAHLQLYTITTSKEDRVKFLNEAKEGIREMKEWAEFGPVNFLHKYYLMQAELYRVTDKNNQAMEYYDKAIEKAYENEYVNEAALANELAAKFYMQQNRDKLAALYFMEARDCYRKWGAVAKVKHLEENYPKYLSMSIPGTTLSTGTISATDTTIELLDVKSIIKASQTLSGEVKLASLLERMMHILVENAGAQKSMLIENIDDSLLIQAEGTADGVSGILQRQPVEESENVPLSVINYVARSEKKLVFDNISKDPNYSSDPYIQKHQPKSAVCFPIVRKDELSAIIYLENNLVEGAFTPERMNVLNTLSSQIAISIENARIYRDLAELNKGLEQKVAERTRQLEEMDKAKSRFFANISHEFRTPLTLIMGPLEKRLSLSRDEQDIQEMQMMLRNSRRLLNLVNQLLELARLESGKMKLEVSRQNIVPFVKNIVMCFESLAGQDKVDLIFHKQEENITVYFDPEKLEKIITNLLSNAFKYTPAGGTITVSVRRLAGNDRFPSGCVEISVGDTGTGIPRDQLPHIFDRFYRGEGGHEYKGKGAGIGLALTKELVDLHHGEIEVQSSCRDDDSRGSEFFLRLPMGEDHLQPEEMVEIKEPEEGTARRAMKSFSGSPGGRFFKKAPLAAGGNAEEKEEVAETVEAEKEEKSLVLVVEDNDDVRTYIRGSLEPQFKVVEAADGKEGILRAKEIIPDLIVSDVMMPETDGFELCRTLKKDVLTCHVPIILLTARVSEESVLQGLETGADDYITKPFSTDLLAVRVRNLIDLRRQLQLEQKNRMAFQPGEIPVSPLDDEFYKKLQDTIETHLSDPDFSVESLCRVLDMSQATLYRKIHGLTGKSPTLFLRSFRIKRAAQLLQANAGSVSDVAVKVGFPDKSYFARCFKEQFHCLPSDVQTSGVSEPVEENEINQKFLRGGPGGAVFSKSVPPGRRRQDTILVVEDSEDTRTYIRQSLEPDYHVVEAVDGSEGIARAMEIIPDLVISDIMMPGMDGYELCRALKQDVRSCHIPIVLLTAKAAEESKIKGLELGADDYITKPFNTRILLARIKNLIQLRSHLQEKRNREMTLLPVKISEPEIDREFMKELNAVIEENLEDPDFNVEQLAKKLYMSSATLYRKVQALSGEIPSEYIRSFRLRRAAQLFKENFGSVTEVAFEVGFNSRTYFTKCFKEKFHQLPSVYMAIE